MPIVGIELTTYRLQGGCSTTELNRLQKTAARILPTTFEMTDFAFCRCGRARRRTICCASRAVSVDCRSVPAR